MSHSPLRKKAPNGKIGGPSKFEVIKTTLENKTWQKDKATLVVESDGKVKVKIKK